MAIISQTNKLKVCCGGIPTVLTSQRSRVAADNVYHETKQSDKHMCVVSGGPADRAGSLFAPWE